MMKKLTEKQNIILGSSLLLIITFFICWIIVIYNPVKKTLHPLEIQEPNTVEFIGGDENFSVEISPIDCSMYINDYIDYEKISHKDYYKTDQMTTIDLSKINYDFIKNIDTLPSSPEITEEINQTLSQYVTDNNYENIPEDIYKKLSNDIAYDYDSYCGYYYNIVLQAPLTQEETVLSAVLQVMAENTTLHETNDDYIAQIYNELYSTVGKQAKQKYLNEIYTDIPEDITEEELNYLLYELADIEYKRQILLLYLIDQYQLWPTDDEVNTLLQTESERLGITTEEYVETVKSWDYLKNHIANQNLIKYLYDTVMENK